MISRRNLFTTAGATLVVTALPFAAMAGETPKGKFSGKSNHITTGSVKILKSADGYVVELGNDFKFDGAPDPKVALGADGYDKNTLMGLLKSNSGKQSFKIPASVDPSKYNEVWIWCEQYNVPLGIAKLN